MKKSILIASLAAAGMALGSTPLYADGAQPWHITGTIGGVNLQNSRDTRNDDVLLGVGVQFDSIGEALPERVEVL